MNTNPKISFLALQHVTPTWRNILMRIEKDNYTTNELKAGGFQAVSIFRKVLGERFFRDNGQEHPLQRNWGNIVPWQIAELGEWARALEGLQIKSSPESFFYLCELLKSRSKCQQEGIHFLKLAASLMRVGFTLEFIRGEHNKKSPDIAVSDSSGESAFYVEVTHLEKNAKFKQDEINFRLIGGTSLHFGFNLLTYIQVRKSMTKNEVQEAITLIAETARMANEQDDFQTQSNEVIEVTFASTNCEAQFEKWLLSNNKRKGVHGLPVNPDETIRLTERGRIEKKVKQIPFGATGIIYFGVEFLYFLYMDRRKVVQALKKAMAGHTKLKGIVLCCDAIDPCDNLVEEFGGQEDLYSVNCVEGHTTLYLYCINDQYQGDISEQIFCQFRRSLIPSGC